MTPQDKSSTQLTVIFACMHARKATCDFKLGKSAQGDNVFDREKHKRATKSKKTQIKVFTSLNLDIFLELH